MCILFVEDSLATFGAVAELKKVLLAREGAIAQLAANKDAAQLLTGRGSHSAGTRDSFRRTTTSGGIEPAAGLEPFAARPFASGLLRCRHLI